MYAWFYNILKQSDICSKNKIRLHDSVAKYCLLVVSFTFLKKCNNCPVSKLIFFVFSNLKGQMVKMDTSSRVQQECIHVATPKSCIILGCSSRRELQLPKPNIIVQWQKLEKQQSTVLRKPGLRSFHLASLRTLIRILPSGHSTL